MQFRLGPLLAAALISGSTAAWIYGAPRTPYQGFFTQRDQVERLYRAADPTVRIQSSGGGGTSTSEGFTSHYTHALRSGQAINEEYVAALRSRMLGELRRRGFKAESHQEVLDGDKFHVYARGFREATRVFQVSFEEGDFRGVITFRVMSTYFPAGALQHSAELFESIAIFPRN
jgi:hypothetical protein